MPLSMGPISMTLFTYLLLQIDRLKTKPPPHMTGPRRPDLSQTDAGYQPNG